MLRKFLGLTRHAPITSAHWHRVVADLPFLRHLDDAQRRRLKARCEAFLATKQFSGAAGFEIDDDVRVGIAVQACLPALNLEGADYRDFVEIVVYPDRFVAPRRQVDDAGVVHEYDDELAGEAMHGGPVVLSWPDADPEAGHLGYNVVIHEFAHYLDQDDGAVNGAPILDDAASGRRWATVMQAELEQLRLSAGRGEATLLDPYAAEDEGEFFAVASEAFFELPQELRAAHPALYAELAGYYRLDPAAW